MKPETLNCDIVVVGLGPSGAMLANLLGPRAWSVVAIERDEDVYYAPRAVHFDDEAMRIFQAAGLADEIAGTSESFSDMELRLNIDRPPVMRTKIGSQDGRYGHAGAWWFHQPTLERHLREGVARYANVTTLYGAAVHSLTEDDHGVTVEVATNDGSSRTVRCRYLIGCDGGRSFVRKAAGLALDSAKFDEAWVVVDAKTRSGKKDPRLPANHIQVCNRVQPVTYVPMAGPYYEWQFMVTGGKTEREATDPQLVREQLRPFVDLDTVEITRIAYYRFHALWARNWRTRRVILAGDSAHQMPPFLGQGMCSGIRDASSLSWRLNLVLAGAPDGLLSDYETERAGHVRAIIQGAMFLGRLIQTRRLLIALLRNNLLFRPANRVPFLNRLIYQTANRKRPLTNGLIGRNRRRIAGHLAPQPKVQAYGAKAVPLDDVLGNDFALLFRRDAISNLHPAVKRAREQLTLKLVSFDVKALPGSVLDMEGKLDAWFRQHRIDFVLIRPDRYVFDGGKISQLNATITPLLQAMGGRTSPQLKLALAA
ncbi:bifunctional 3-(3-hydroxy-phenyl)propionate/3-hydroxycinnamic acid hydroxylase [Paraburkholderia dipogonis]|uniref:Bifunctional 3-(3-hydroxy-phenyl)propionate/3-hydroxycinnamic acid hydroxylase n=1 Tax=Paraburkholderia dipogonis TaxID=1211383 RepID=A0A4Y8MGJ2_9BURK|nr:bifunctional 3-(3-hydroxy-phenyl)propionate/3-hydroxycinnamic acid hydroxylase [Paraburkholderia dipogonis]TFE36513.1 bifunctional 3-(3-hydroxy-phenyl)propionate/3-hydroxycinnamic acid hydroxylase [Paraburkholderia dipogonis]